MERLVAEGEYAQLTQRWVFGERVGDGGFGQVFAVKGEDGADAVAKIVPKAPGADRELLFVRLDGVRNVLPVIDSGEHLDKLVLVMPRADLSLREHIDASGETLSIDEAVVVLGDIADALSDLESTVVHRDLKPENVLRLNGKWCLADFGIARYAEASTAPDTQKYAMSVHYAAPERWRAERATIAVDVYALGVIAYELLTGSLPFDARTVEEFREAHLHHDPRPLEGVPLVLVTLVEECLYKAPATRPSPENFRARLTRFHEKVAASPGLAQLQAANHHEVRRRAQAEREASEARTAEEQRLQLVDSAERGFLRLSQYLREELMDSAPSASLTTQGKTGWTLSLGQASLTLTAPAGRKGVSWGSWGQPPFVVAAHASLSLRLLSDRYGYEGRSHSLWFGDIQQTGVFGWHETAFMISPMTRRKTRQEPFALDPNEKAAKAVWAGMAEYQVAWPFTRINLEDLDELVGRWALWFGRASAGQLGRPSTMPEKAPQGSWRQL